MTRTTKIRTATAALLGCATLALAACGGSGDETGDGSADVDETPAAAPSSGGSTFAVAADPAGSLAYETTEAGVDAGSVTIEFTNESDVVHDVVIEDESGEAIAMTERVTGGETTANAKLAPGTYTYFCSITGHRGAGMEGTLTVE